MKKKNKKQVFYPKVRITVNEKEKAFIKKCADKYNMSMAEYLKHCVGL